MSRHSDLRPIRALVGPFWLGALAVLLLNDHFFKGSGFLPGWLTGKLSDFAGLCVAPALVAVMVRARTRQAILFCHAFVGLGFAALELSPELTRAADAIYHVAGVSWRSTSDPTDLLALFILPLSHYMTVRAGARSDGPSRRWLGQGVTVAGLLSCAASTGAQVDQPPPCAGPDCDFDGYDTPEDCNDSDPTVHPGAGCPNPNGEDVCDDGIDNDNDHLVDCDDPDCALACQDIEQACVAGSLRHFDEVAFLEGSTLTGTSVTDGSCVGADSPEVIFQGDIPSAGVLSLGIPKDHGIHVRRTCADAFTEVACSVATNGTLDVTFGEPGNVTVVVEALDPFKASAFKVPVSFRTLQCGDGILQAGEGCDDGNNVSGDGCSASCDIEYDSLCGQLPVVLDGTLDDSFALATTAFVGECGGTTTTPEKGYRFVPTSTFTLLSVAPTAPVFLYATTGCGTGTSLACIPASASANPTMIGFPTTPGQSITVFVELAPASPPGTTFSLTITEP